MEEQDDSMDTNGNLPIPLKQENTKVKREVVVNPTIIEFQKVSCKILTSKLGHFKVKQFGNHPIYFIGRFFSKEFEHSLIQLKLSILSVRLYKIILKYLQKYNFTILL